LNSLRKKKRLCFSALVLPDPESSASEEPSSSGKPFFALDEEFVPGGLSGEIVAAELSSAAELVPEGLSGEVVVVELFFGAESGVAGNAGVGSVAGLGEGAGEAVCPSVRAAHNSIREFMLPRPHAFQGEISDYPNVERAQCHPAAQATRLQRRSTTNAMSASRSRNLQAETVAGLSPQPKEKDYDDSIDYIECISSPLPIAG
jgi:hypothetical protein